MKQMIYSINKDSIPYSSTIAMDDDAQLLIEKVSFEPTISYGADLLRNNKKAA
jgi:hypothetical protein